MEGPHTLTFRLYDAEKEGTSVWQETQTAIVVTQGYFSVLLGSVKPFKDANQNDLDWAKKPLWLAVKVDNDPELAPRQRITSVPLAVRAEQADKLTVPVTTSTITDDANRLVPLGAMILWDGASCPAGYTRVTALDGKFLVSASSFNPSAGGSNDPHAHGAGSYAGPSHTHTIPATSAIWGMVGPSVVEGKPITSANVGSGRWAASNDPPTSNSGTAAVTGTSASTDSRPAFATVVLCKKD